jgi:hypothetical protein
MIEALVNSEHPQNGITLELGSNQSQELLD